MNKVAADYVLDEHLKIGDTIWRAHHAETGNVVVMKRSYPERFLNRGIAEEEAVDLAFRLIAYEHSILNSVEHEGICEIIEFTKSEKCYWLVLKDYGDSSIDDIDDTMEAGRTFLKLSSAISYLHSKSIIHGDVNPHNVVGDGVLIDFDSAYEPFFWQQWGMPRVKSSTEGYIPPDYDYCLIQPRYDVFGFCKIVVETLRNEVNDFKEVLRLVEAGQSDDFKNLPTMAEIELAFRKAFS